MVKSQQPVQRPEWMKLTPYRLGGDADDLNHNEDSRTCIDGRL